jgi:ketosteroid isomerase-like protein
MTVVATYLDAIATHDWDRLRATLADDVVRTGPYADTYTGRDAYVAFLSELMPTLPGYAMDVARVTYVDEGRRAFAELTETVTMNGTPTVTPEVLVLDLTPDGLISRIVIYTRRG